MAATPPLLSRLHCASPLPFDLNQRACLKLDLSRLPRTIDPADTAAFGAWIAQQMTQAHAAYAAGGYGENRELYQMSALFKSNEAEPRTVHLGIDLWHAAGAAVHAVLGGVVHSTADNARFGDYGPTVILEHALEGQVFHTLYGHLSRATLARIHAGQRIATGVQLGWLGEPEENLGWPPHLHFQILRNLGGRSGDYPGVCKPSEQAQWLALCPDPNLLLRIEALR